MIQDPTGARPAHAELRGFLQPREDAVRSRGSQSPQAGGPPYPPRLAAHPVPAHRDLGWCSSCGDIVPRKRPPARALFATLRMSLIKIEARVVERTPAVGAYRL